MSSSSSASSTASRSFMNADGSEKFCRCGLRARRWTSWTDANPGRRFFGCPKFNSGDEDCKFFLWHDDEMPKRVKDVIIEQRDKCKSLSSENTELIQDLELLSHEHFELKKELEIVKTENIELKSLNKDLWNAVESVRCDNIKIKKDMENEKTENMELRKSLEIIRSWIGVHNGGEKKINKWSALIVFGFGMLLCVVYKLFRRSEMGGDKLAMLG